MRGEMSLPAPIAEFPWRVVIPLTLLVAFGAAVLHSAGGGSFSPYADSHLIRFGVFLDATKLHAVLSSSICS